MNQLELVLKKPIEELIPQLIQFNNSELMTAAKNMLSAYKDIEYSEDMITQAKQDKATLNKFCTALDEERKSIKRTYEEPLVKFTNEVNEVITTIKGVSNDISSQLDVYEEKRKVSKLAQIEEHYNGLGEIAQKIVYSKIHNPKWLNASVPMTSIKTDIENILQGVSNDLDAISALQSENETTILALYLRNLSLSAALTEHKRLEHEKELAKQIQKPIAPQQPPLQVQSQPKPQEQSQQPLEMKIIQFEVEASAEQFAALRQFLVSNNIIYRSIKK